MAGWSPRRWHRPLAPGARRPASAASAAARAGAPSRGEPPSRSGRDDPGGEVDAHRIPFPQRQAVAGSGRTQGAGGHVRSKPHRAGDGQAAAPARRCRVDTPARPGRREPAPGGPGGAKPRGGPEVPFATWNRPAPPGGLDAAGRWEPTRLVFAPSTAQDAVGGPAAVRAKCTAVRVTPGIAALRAPGRDAGAGAGQSLRVPALWRRDCTVRSPHWGVAQAAVLPPTTSDQRPPQVVAIPSACRETEGGAEGAWDAPARVTGRRTRPRTAPAGPGCRRARGGGHQGGAPRPVATRIAPVPSDQARCASPREPSLRMPYTGDTPCCIH